MVGSVTGDDGWTNGHVMFLSPTPRHEDAKEAWRLTCTAKKGKVRATRNVVVDRGDRVNVGNVCPRGSLARAKAAAGGY
jgi:hypothetical protein